MMMDNAQNIIICLLMSHMHKSCVPGIHGKYVIPGTRLCNPSVWWHYIPSYCCAGGGFSAWGFKFLLHGAKFVSERHYHPNN
jgi:hypothetical protein